MKKVEANRNFANKVWNAGRFVINAISSLDKGPVAANRLSDTEHWTLADSWIWARLQQLLRDVERLFETFQYGEAGRQIYEFFWSDFADWYVEIAKGQLQAEETREQTVVTLARVMDTVPAAAAPLHAIYHGRALGTSSQNDPRFTDLRILRPTGPRRSSWPVGPSRASLKAGKNPRSLTSC